MKEAAQKQIVEIFATSNRLDQKAIPAKVRSVIAHTAAPVYLFTECLDPSGVSNSPNPIDGLLITQATRMFKVVSGMLSLLTLGQAQQAEILSRTAMESALTLLYIAQGDSGARFIQFFEHYIAQEKEQNRKWLKELTSQPEPWKKDHEERIRNKNSSLEATERFLQVFAAQIGATFPSDKGFPNFVSICTTLNKAIEHRTVYMAMCSQAHHDAEDILNDLMVGTSPNGSELTKNLGKETDNFSIFLVLHGARYCVECVGALGARYHFASVSQQSRKSYAVLSDYLHEVCSGGFVKNSLRGWLP